MAVLEALAQGAQALIFDCDGTLVDTPDLYAHAWQSAFEAAGLKMTADWYHERAGMSEHVLMDAYETGFGAVPDREKIVATMRQIVMQRLGEVREIPAVVEIARQYGGGKPMAVASGGPRSIVLASLRGTGLLPLFDAVVTIEDVAHAKPSPDLFIEAARRLQVPPGQCLVFEDSPQGLQAARNAGMEAIDVNAIIAC